LERREDEEYRAIDQDIVSEVWHHRQIRKE
jgi:hypothetical protein